MDRFEMLRRVLKERCPALELREQEGMTRHTTFRLGGPVRLMALPKTREEAVCAVRTAWEMELEPFFLGNGSNLLVPDEGVERFVVKLMDGLTDCRVEGETIYAESGLLLSRLANTALEHGLTGLEFAHGIPGTLGGAVTMNAGAYEGEMAQVVTAVECLNTDGSVERVTDCGFGYRHSHFSDGKRLILGAELKLSQGDRGEIRAKMEDLMNRRKSKQPLEYPSAGSMFKRPAGCFAASLIDQCGLKGYTVGGAQVSEKHAGFVVNRGGATCGDVLRLVDGVRERVLKETGVELEMEVKLLK